MRTFGLGQRRRVGARAEAAMWNIIAALALIGCGRSSLGALARSNGAGEPVGSRAGSATNETGGSPTSGASGGMAQQDPIGGGGGEAGTGGGDAGASPSPPACRSDSLGRPLAPVGPADDYRLEHGGGFWIDYMFDDTFVTARGNVVGDVTGDGRPDLVTSDEERLFIFEWDRGALREPHRLQLQPGTNLHKLLVDMNADGTLDIVTSMEGGLSVTLSNGDSTWQDPEVIEGPMGDEPVRRPRLLDLNDDGSADLFGAYNHPGDITKDFVLVYYGPAFDSFSLTPLRTSVRRIEIADLDGDGELDLLAAMGTAIVRFGATVDDPDDADAGASQRFYSVSALLEGQEVGTPVELVTLEDDLKEFSVVDLDGDGLSELVATSYANTQPAAIFWQRPDGSFRAPEVLTSTWTEEILVHDLNHDGSLDFALSGSPWIHAFLQRATGLEALPIVELEPGGSVVFGTAIADLNCDGCLDITVPLVMGPQVLLGSGCGG